MYGGNRDDGWTVVSYRRDRFRRPREGRPSHRLPEHRSPYFHEATGQRPTYASVVRGRGRQGSYPQHHHYVEHGYRPQFFVPGGRRAPTKQHPRNIINRNTHYTTHRTGTNTRKENYTTQRTGINTRRENHTTQRTGINTRREKREGKPVEKKTQSSDPNFGIKVRMMHKVIKMAHHLRNVLPQKPPPPSIRKFTENLTTIIKPASPNEETRLLIEGNAKNWELTTMMILRDHYTDSMEMGLDALRGLGEGEWREPFQIATVWAKRNLGKRLQSETLEHVEALMAGHLDPTTEEEDGTGPDGGPPPPPPPPPPPAMGKQKTKTVTKRVSKMKRDTNRGNSELKGRGETHTEPQDLPSLIVPETPTNSPLPVQALERPRAPTLVTTATMTVETGGWSPPQEENLIDIADPLISQVPPPHLTPTILPHSSPKPQRVRRTDVSVPDSLEKQTENLPEVSPAVLDAPVPTAATPSPIVAHMSDSITVLSEEEGLDPAQGSPEVVPPTQATPAKLRSLRRATQRRLTLRPRPVAKPTTPESTIHRPKRHISTKHKTQDWVLSMGKRFAIIGDSNLSRMPPFECQELQIDSYPGATLAHAKVLIENATTSARVEKIILSFGINNRRATNKTVLTQQLLATMEAAEKKFPLAEIWVPLINFSPHLPLQEKSCLTHLNNKMQQRCLIIPKLDSKLFSTNKDNIHWSTQTARSMLEHWSSYVKCMSP
uniref:Uncharacterized protein n=1 Tax=Larimichthys crocea TaxID=215358 RepID=A0A0F8AD58_LARCR